MVREITCGSTPVSEIEKFAQWVNEKNEDNQLELPTHFLSLDVEELQISTWDRKRILSPEFRGVSLVLSDEDN